MPPAASHTGLAQAANDLEIMRGSSPAQAIGATAIGSAPICPTRRRNVALKPAAPRGKCWPPPGASPSTRAKRTTASSLPGGSTRAEKAHAQQTAHISYHVRTSPRVGP
eukprot:6160898-Pyramimonas_sp.AAC.1